MPPLAPPDFLLRTLSRQLGRPTGRLGGLVARILNKGNGPVIREAVEMLELTGGETVADIGFGGGLGLDLLLSAVGPSGRVHGVDPSADMVARARRAHDDVRLELHEATMESLPFARGGLDGWISLNTIYFIAELAPAFAELARVLAPGGRGVLCVGDPDWMAKQAFTRHGFTLRPIDDVVAALEEAGLSVSRHVPQAAHMPDHLLVCTLR